QLVRRRAGEKGVRRVRVVAVPRVQPERGVVGRVRLEKRRVHDAERFAFDGNVVVVRERARRRVGEREWYDTRSVGSRGLFGRQREREKKQREGEGLAD